MKRSELVSFVRYILFSCTNFHGTIGNEYHPLQHFNWHISIEALQLTHYQKCLAVQIFSD